MDDRHFAMVWQLMQSLGSHTHEDQSNLTEPPSFENTLITLKPLMSPSQQKIIDLMIKMQEVKALIDEIQYSH